MTILLATGMAPILVGLNRSAIVSLPPATSRIMERTLFILHTEKNGLLYNHYAWVWIITMQSRGLVSWIKPTFVNEWHPHRPSQRGKQDALTSGLTEQRSA